ncbi:hypothetical protein D0T84_21380 [Dysgonomonas sp. 521]|uniref:hypothetical protein n=1 Tax=Dysgonomonas sp. 521 TaxID=2302932 RepID=UPI0013D03FB9|nr:hypothetical protein [Dysgonomonas sp. 521]NDV97429.1 hypothetical protein [Dysgonomonas sp. 521]
MKLKLTLFLSILFILTSCSEIESTDPIEVYRYWSGTKPTDNLNLKNGQYWQSPHWTKEYIMYLEFQPTTEWWNEFTQFNNLKADTIIYTLPDNKPEWFNPTETYIRYRVDKDFDQGSRYFRDTITGNCFIYEVQL